MEVKKIFKILAKYFYVIAALIILGAVIGFRSAKFLPSGYNRSQLFFLTATPQPSTQNSYYSPFFVQETARNFTDTVTAILEDSKFLDNLSQNRPSISVKKIAPQLIRITARSRQNNLDDSLTEVAAAYNQKIAALSAGYAPTLQAVSEATPSVYFALNGLVLALAGAVLGFLFSLLIIGLKVYLKL